jgi:hypothetical protein
VPPIAADEEVFTGIPLAERAPVTGTDAYTDDSDPDFTDDTSGDGPIGLRLEELKKALGITSTRKLLAGSSI